MVDIFRYQEKKPTCHAAICCRILSLTAGQGSPNCQSTLQEACQGYLQGQSAGWTLQWVVLLEQRLAPLQQQHAAHEQDPHHRVQNNVRFRFQSEDSDCLIDTNIKHLVFVYTP